jgi:phosphoribosylformylglycinamidine (FGAM) synthase PurS component
VDAPSPENALQIAHAAAQRLLHNPVVETYHLRLLPSP